MNPLYPQPLRLITALVILDETLQARRRFLTASTSGR